MTESTAKERLVSVGWLVTDKGCWEWLGSKAVRGGYGQIMDRGTLLKAHRVAHELWIGPIPEGLFVLHSCDNPPCINPEHLRAGTNKENSEDSVNRGRAVHQVMTGKYSPNARLTWEQVLEIRASRFPYSVLAKQYGVSKVSIGNIKRRKTWKDEGSVRTATVRPS